MAEPKDEENETQMQPSVEVEDGSDTAIADDSGRKQSKQDKDEIGDADHVDNEADDEDIDLDAEQKGKKRKRDDQNSNVNEKKQSSSSPPLKKSKTSKRKKVKAEANMYVVERIVGWRMHDNVIEYQVKWEGYGEQENSWEPIENLNENEKFQNFILEIMMGCIASDASLLVDTIRKTSPEGLKAQLLEKYHFGDNFDKAALRKLLNCTPKVDAQLK